jgi:hypothetical protein
VDAVAGGERRRRREGAAELDRRRVEADLLLGLAQRGGGEVGVALVLAAAGEGDLAGVAAQVGAALGEDQPRLVRPAEERQQHGGVGPPPGLHLQRLLGREQPVGEAQMITWTVPPSTDQAAPAT